MGNRALKKVSAETKRRVREIVQQCVVELSDLVNADEVDLQWMAEELSVEFVIDVYPNELRTLNYAEIVNLVRNKNVRI